MRAVVGSVKKHRTTNFTPIDDMRKLRSPRRRLQDTTIPPSIIGQDVPKAFSLKWERLGEIRIGFRLLTDCLGNCSKASDSPALPSSMRPFTGDLFEREEFEVGKLLQFADFLLGLRSFGELRAVV